MRLRVVLVLFVLVSWVNLTSAQYRNVTPGGDPSDYMHSRTSLGIKGFRGLLDPSRMHMSQSVEFGYTSVGGQSGTRGLYMNRIDYQISRPLALTSYLGYQFQPSGPAEWNPANYGNDFVGGADLNWRPTSNSLFRISVYRGMYPYSYGNYGLGHYGYGSYLDRP